MPLPPQAQYTSREALFEAVQAWAKPLGNAFSTSKSKRTEGNKRWKVYYTCDRSYQPPTRSRVRHTSAHRDLKRYIPSSQSNHLTTWLGIEQAICNQFSSIKAYIEKERIYTLLNIDKTLCSSCFGITTNSALRLVEEHRKSVEYPLKPCTNSYSRVSGLPCIHKIEEYKLLGGLQPQDFHEHWYWVRYPSSLRPYIL